MNFPFYIARRYVFAKKSHNAINIISAISIVGIAVGTIAFITVLSVFNGFDGVVKELFSTFYADFEVVPKQGKSFTIDEAGIAKLKNHKDILNISEIIEENALIIYQDRQTIATVRGVDEHYEEVTGIDTMLWNGNYSVEKDSAYIGRAFERNLNVLLSNPDSMKIIAVKRTEKSFSIPERNLTYRSIVPSGSFSSHAEIESKYILVPIEFARELFEYPKEISAIEIKVRPGVSLPRLQESVQQIVGKKLTVKNRLQQNDLLYRTMRSEKWAIFFILVFILLVSSFNVVGTLSMLIIEKKNDINTLRYLGMPLRKIKRTFLIEGLIISLLGAISGLIIGTIICYIQQEFGIVKLAGAEAFVIDAYPIKVILSDIILVLFSVLIIGFVASWYPIRFITKRHLQIEK
ncbi:MAG: FtsX-like permease family protein [Bacteroidales bacterium]|nr:FtsX-like permease family protein [Bacteroidales bacterium]